VDALYGFVRVPDEMVDTPYEATPEETRLALQEYRAELLRGLGGTRPNRPVLRAFCDLVREVGIPIEEALLFLDAMEDDLTITRYSDYEALRNYMRGSAVAVGVMMCHILETSASEASLEAAKALGEAMQLTNFLRDVGEDAARGRIYLPREDLDAFGVREENILERKMSAEFRALMAFEIERTRELYLAADKGVLLLPRPVRSSVHLARVLYSRILSRIEERGHDVFSGRARTSNFEKLSVAGRVWFLGV
jgi:phytoene synthase